MKLTKTLTALALAAALCVPAAAAGTEDKFPAVNIYPGYADVQETDWFYQNAKLCYETGIITGTDRGFEPNKTLTVSEVAAVAARMRETLTGHAIPAPEPNPGKPWYAHYVEYLKGEILEQNRYAYVLWLLDTPTADVSRYGALCILEAALEGSEDLLTPINDIAALPDCKEPGILQFYNAGILTGVDKYGTFQGEKTLTRAEVAAMLSRIVRPALRKTFTPADYSMFTAAYLTPGTVLFEGGVTAETFLPAVNAAIAKYEAALGENFNWHADVGGKTVLEAVKDETLTALGVTSDRATDAYKDFDYQVYYSRLIDLTGETL